MHAAHELVVDDGVHGVPQARAFVSTRLGDAHPDVVADAKLVVTELVTNAVLHGLPPVVVRVVPQDTGCRLEVEDGRHALPLASLHSTEAMTGRGLRLVGSLSRAWGVEPASRGGKVVWAELAPAAEHRETAPEIALDDLLAAWSDDDEAGEVSYTVRLGAVPTDLLLEAKAHIDNVVREAILAEGGRRESLDSSQMAALVETVTQGFASARTEIKRQALAAAARGDVETELVLTQPASAADAGERYLQALDIVDQYARQARMLTLEAPPLHKVFRRWYVQALVDQLRAASTGRPVPPARTFVQVLADEVGTVAALRDAADRLTLLQDVAAELTGARTVQEIGHVVIDKATRYLGAMSGRVMLVDGECLQTVASVGGPTALSATYDQVPLDADLPGAVVLRERRAMMLANLAQIEQRFPELRGIYATDRTLHVAPLIIGDHVLGVLSLSFDVGGRLALDAQSAFVKALADALAQAIERAQAMLAAERAGERLAFLADASVALSASLDYDSTAEAVGALLVPRLADWSAVQVLDGGSLVTSALTHYDPARLDWARRMSELYPTDMSAPSGAPNVIRTGRPELFVDVSAEVVEAAATSPEHLQILREFGFSSALVVPMIGRRGVLGAITLIYAESGRHYGPEDVPFAEDVARRAALALETAQVLRDQSGRLADVTRVAEAAQLAILAPPPDVLGAVRLGARYMSAAAEALVGGDLYEVVTRPGAVRLLIGDVRGKGLAAVRTATIALGEFRSAAADLDDLADTARQMDRRLGSYLGAEDFVTALLAEIRDDGSLQVVACGHPPALLLRDGSVEAITAEPALPLGLGAQPTTWHGQMRVGDRLVLMTDGLLEARQPDRSFVDVAVMVAPLATSASLDEGLDQMLARLRVAVGGELGDDLALLVAEYAGGPAATQD